MLTLTRTLAAAAALAVIATPAYAQRINTGATGEYGQTQLRAGFEPDPFTVSVLGGGPIDSTTVNAECYAGYLSARASYSVRYTANTAEFPQLFIGATSDADTTIAVRTPNGQWLCNDDTNGLDPMVTIDQPRNGRYQIWVGRFGTASETAQATLFVSEVGGPQQTPDSAGAPDFSLDPAYGAIDLAAGFLPDPHTIGIAAGGSYDASQLGQPGCVGWIASAPDYRVNWAAGAETPLIFSVQSDADTTLVINDAQGNWVCNDDTNGLNPEVAFANAPAGQYDVWVGTYMQGDLQDSVLNVSELPTGQ